MNLLGGDVSPENAKGGGDGLETYAPGLGQGQEKGGTASTVTPSGDDGGLRVSLMLSEDEGHHGGDMGRRILILLLVVVLETAVLGTGYYLLMRKDAALVAGKGAAMQELQAAEQKVKAAEADAHDVVAFGAQVNADSAALDSHLYWTSLFNFIEQRTLPAVRYLNFSGDADSGVVTMDATGLTYRDVAEQIVKFREDPMVKSLKTTSAAAAVDQLGNVTGVNFTMVLTLDPAVWKQADLAASGATPSSAGTSAGTTSATSSIAPSSGTSGVTTPAERAAASSTAPVTGRTPLDVVGGGGTATPSNAGSGTGTSSTAGSVTSPFPSAAQSQ